MLVGLMAVCTAWLAAGAEPASPGARAFQSAGNPILGDGSFYSADAAPLSHDGKLYLYVGRDEPELFHGGFVMNEYGVFSTDDPATGKWTLHPRNLVPGEVFSWATGKKAFAGHCIRGKDGRFYWYVPVEAKEDAPRMAIGVAVSDSPLGPWRDPAGKPLVTWKNVFGDSERGQEVIDPHAFIDEDGKPYLYWGSWGVARVVGLADSMIETTGEIRVMDGLDAFFEAPWVIKRGGIYYMAYDWKRGGSEWTPSNYQACIGYATSDSPTGPWKFQGIILSGTSATTVHPRSSNTRGNGGLHTIRATPRMAGISAARWPSTNSSGMATASCRCARRAPTRPSSGSPTTSPATPRPARRSPSSRQ